MSKVDVVTFGCRLNAVESEAVRRAAEASSDVPTIVFNTCAVTEEAVRQARQAIRRAGREQPEARLIVTGCAAQIDPEKFSSMPEVTAVIGNADKAKPDVWRNLAQEGVAKVNDIFALDETAHHFVAGAVDSIEGHTRAFVEVQNGCDHRCTFCIIPFGRARRLRAMWSRKSESFAPMAIAKLCSRVSISPLGAMIYRARRLSAGW